MKVPALLAPQVAGTGVPLAVGSPSRFITSLTVTCNDSESTSIAVLDASANPPADTTSFEFSNAGLTMLGLAYLFPASRQGIIGLAACG